MMYELVYRTIGYNDDTIDVFMRTENKDEITKVIEQYDIPVRNDWDKMSCGFYIREVSTIALKEYQLKRRLEICQKEKKEAEELKAMGPIFNFNLDDLI